LNFIKSHHLSANKSARITLLIAFRDRTIIAIVTLLYKTILLRMACIS